MGSIRLLAQRKRKAQMIFIHFVWGFLLPAFTLRHSVNVGAPKQKNFDDDFGDVSGVSRECVKVKNRRRLCKYCYLI